MFDSECGGCAAVFGSDEVAGGDATEVAGVVSNEPNSATAVTWRADCNRSATPPFAAVRG